MLPRPTLVASDSVEMNVSWKLIVLVSAPRLPSTVAIEAEASSKAESAVAAATVLLMFCAPRLNEVPAKALFDLKVKVEPSMLAITLIEVDRPDSRLRPL